MFVDFFLGLGAHAQGIRFALARKGYLGMVLLPFALTVLLYVLGFSLFAAHSDRLLALLGAPEQAPAVGTFMAALVWLYVHLVKYLLYLLAFALMYFLFMVTANILASPLYDHIAGRLAREAAGDRSPGEAKGLSLWRTMIEEVKKALFVAAIPLLLVWIPIAGQFLAPLAAAWLLAFDFVDFSLGRDEPRFAGRRRFLWRRPLLLLGFGLPLLVPFLNLVLYPFAILGSCLLYQKAAGRPLAAYPQK